MQNKEKKEKAKKPSIFFRIGQVFVKLFTTKYQIQSLEELKTDGIRIICTNHAQMGGPLAYQLYYPYKKKIWCISDVFSRKTFPQYAMKEFWPNKQNSKWYKMNSHLLAPLASFVFKNADVIPVYRDHRFLTTIRQTTKCLDEGYDIIIMPEKHEKYNLVVNEYEENFVSVAKLYSQKTQKKVYFYPSYVAPNCKKVLIGHPIEYNPNNDFDVEKKRICAYLKENTTDLAHLLPSHIVVQYVKEPHSKPWVYQKSDKNTSAENQKMFVTLTKKKTRK